MDRSFLFMRIGAATRGPMRLFRNRPPVAPATPPRELARHKDLVARCRYLIRALDYRAGHPALGAADRTVALEEASDLQWLLRSHPLLEDLYRAIDRTEGELLPALDGRIGGGEVAPVRTAEMSCK